MFYNFLSTTAGNIKQFVEKYVEIEIDFEEIDRRTDRFLEWIVPFIPWEWLEVTICSHLLSDKAIRIMSKKRI